MIVDELGIDIIFFFLNKSACEVSYCSTLLTIATIMLGYIAEEKDDMKFDFARVLNIFFFLLTIRTVVDTLLFVSEDVDRREVCIYVYFTRKGCTLLSALYRLFK